MLKDIGRLFRRSIEAFRAEASVREPEDQIAELLAAMRREMVAARAAIPEFEEDAARAKVELARETDALALCERRGAMAERIGDHDTVRVAAEFATKHRERIAILEKRVATSEAELSFRRKEAEEMVVRYREADANRFALLAQIRSATARERMRSNLSGDDDLAHDWSRMEERVERDGSYVDALQDLEDPAPPPPSRPTQAELDERLRELKRRMGKP